MANNQLCLEGKACPECGSEGPFTITGTARFLVDDDGPCDFSNAEWDEDADCECKECGHDGTVKSFTLSGENT